MSTSGFFETGGVGLRYALDGNGPHLVVLIHEMGGSIESWNRLVPLLGPECTILRFDMRGFGLSTKVSGTNDLNAIADDLAALLDALDLDMPAHLVGMAIGGAAAIRFAVRYPKAVARLAPIGPAIGVTVEKREGVLARAERIEREGIPAISAEELAITYPDVLRPHSQFASYRARWLGNDSESYAATYRMLASLNMEADLVALRCPVLLLAGTLDPLRPPEMIEPLARQIRDARFLAICAGHVMGWQAPEKLALTLREFWLALDQIPGKKGYST